MAFKLDPQKKAEWVAALRSGEYTQGGGVLRGADDTFCCLGVYCDLMNPEGWVQIFGAGVYHFRATPDAPFAYGVLPEGYEFGTTHGDFRNEAGEFRATVELWEKFPSRIIPGEMYSLTELNDGGWTFENIADVIEIIF